MQDTQCSTQKHRSL